MTVRPMAMNYIISLKQCTEAPKEFEKVDYRMPLILIAPHADVQRQGKRG